MKALIIGSFMACALGLTMGAILKPGSPPPAPDLQDAAESVADLAFTPAEAAEPTDDPSPLLYVKWGGRWVTEAERQADIVQRQDAAAVAAEQADNQAAINQAEAIIDPLQPTSPTADTARIEPGPQAQPDASPPALAPPIVISALQPSP
jgi:hypothetical protein